MKLLLSILCLSVLLFAQSHVLAAPQQGADQRSPPKRPSDPVTPDRVNRPEDARHRDDERRPPRMSPEERKALRQQIHDASHDLYRPKH